MQNSQSPQSRGMGAVGVYLGLYLSNTLIRFSKGVKRQGVCLREVECLSSDSRHRAFEAPGCFLCCALMYVGHKSRARRDRHEAITHTHFNLLQGEVSRLREPIIKSNRNAMGRYLLIDTETQIIKWLCTHATSCPLAVNTTLKNECRLNKSPGFGSGLS